MIRAIKIISLLTLLLILWTPETNAQGHTDLSSWSGNISFVGSSFDRVGTKLASADFNGDGSWDLAISARGARSNAGDVYLFLGPFNTVNELVYDDLNASADLVIQGSAAMQLGMELHFSDLNDDDLDDLIIGAPRANNSTGEVWIVFGTASIDETPITTPDVIINGANSGDAFGTGIGSSKINTDDTILDLIVGSPSADPNGRDSGGRVDIIYGRITAEWPATIDLSTSAANHTLYGTSSGAKTGHSISKATVFQGEIFGNDINGDGAGDLVFGAPGETYANRVRSGTVHFFSNCTDLPDTLDLTQASGLTDYKIIIGAFNLDQIGRTVASFHNGPRRSLLIGCPAAYTNTNVRGGAIYEVPWATIEGPGTNRDLASNVRYRFKLVSFTNGDSLGATLTASPLNWISGLTGRNSYGRNQAGTVLVLDNAPDFEGSLSLGDLTDENEFIHGSSEGDNLGEVSHGDFDNDGYWDAVVASPDANDFAGSVNLVRGGLPYAYRFNPGPNANNILVGSTFSFDASDDEEEIDPDVTEIEVNGIQYDPTSPTDPVEVTSEEGIYSFTVTPVDPFPIDVIIPVNVKVYDTAGYPSPLYSFSFTTGTDDRGPTVFDLSPDEFETNVATTSNIGFGLRDSGEGVDTNSVSIDVSYPGYNEVIVWGDDRLTASGSIGEYYFTLNPDENFPPDTQVNVALDASDLVTPVANSMETYSYHFSTSLDVLPPAVVGVSPIPNSTIDISTPVTITIHDTLAGVDLSQTQWIRTQNDTPELANFTADEASFGYALTHSPSGNLYDLGPIVFDITSQDYADPPNEMENYSWGYTVIEDSIKPYLLTSEPEPFSDENPRNVPINIQLTDNAAGIDSSSIQVTIDQSIIPHQMMSWERIDYRGFMLDYIPLEGQVYNDTVWINVLAEDRSARNNSLDSTFYFTTLLDEEPPIVELYSPSRGSDGVSIRDSLIWEVRDEMSGVNPETARLIVNEIDVGDLLLYGGDVVTEEAEYRFRYYPQVPFSYEDTLDISFFISDWEIPANVFSVQYNLYTEPDEAPPYLTNIFPSPEQIRVSRNADIQFNVLDSGLGVELDSLKLIIEEELSPFDELFIQEADSGYTIRYNPDGFFPHEDTINVRVICYDQALNPNRLDESYWFVTLSDDHEPPYIDNINPEDQTENWPIDVGFEFDLIDDGSGVDTTFTRIEKVGDPFWPFSRILTPLESGDGYHYQVIPENNWDYSDVVTIQVEARDLVTPPNMTDLPIPFTFSVVRDDDPPLVSEQVPQPDSGFTRNRFMEFTLLDLLAGVDTSSVTLSLNGSEVSENLSVEELMDGWHYKYRPDGLWTVGETINVSLQAADISTSHNLANLSWSFDIIPDISDPFVPFDSLYPQPGASEIALDDTIRIIVQDDGVGVNRNRSDVKIGNQIVMSGSEADTSDLGLEFNIPLGRLALFPGQLVQVTVRSADVATPNNVMENFTYSFTVLPPNEDLAIIPTTFTPNGDGVWDETLIYHEGDPSTEVTIFDIRGRKVAIVSGSPASWNGNDDQGVPVPGGLYIIQLEAAGEIRQATVAVAR